MAVNKVILADNLRKNMESILNLDPLSVVDRFFGKVRTGEGCWEWTGAKSRGYGILSSRRGRSPFKAYRLSWLMYQGEIPKGLVVRHKCDNSKCVRPDHLELGTQKDNSRDMVNRGRHNPKSTENLRPGRKGFLGAGPLSKKEISENGITQ